MHFTRSRSFRHALYLCLAARYAYAYDMLHTDVSNTTFYRDLAKEHIIVTDSIHTQHLNSRESSANSTTTNATSIPVLNTNSGLPLPFDTSLGSNFTETSCPAYFQKFLADDTFLSCLPMSLLLQNSMSFFQAARSSTLLDKTLEQSCTASLAVCSPLMEKLADDLVSASNCQTDYSRENPLVMQAYAGLKAYEPLYQATCLKNATNNGYCFVEAMETDNADDSYPYYAAIGLPLPTGSHPTCSTCLKNSMEIFAGYAAQTDQPLSNTYLESATQINAACGIGFASTQVKSVSKVTANNAIRLSTKNLASMLIMTVIVGVLT